MSWRIESTWCIPQIVAVAASFGLATTSVRAQTSDGFDFSGLPIFWETVDILESGREPTEAEWTRLFHHPGYAQIERQAQRERVLRDVMPLVFMQSKRAALDSIVAIEYLGMSGLRARVARHLVQVRDRRATLTAYADQLRGGDLIARAHERALEYLPAHRLRDVEPPTVYVMLFERNGFGGQNVIVDLLTIMERDEDALVNFLGHELHHSYLGGINRSRNPGDTVNARVVNALNALFFEGTASLIDKPPYLEAAKRERFTGEEREYAKRFATWFEETPDMLQQIDSILAGVARGELDAVTTGRELRQRLPSGGHPTGMFMAATIERQLGRQTVAEIADPFTFLLTYHHAAVAADRYTFSSVTLDYVRGLREVWVH